MSWVGTAIVGTTVVSGYVQSEAAKEGAGAQVESAEAGIAEQRRQFDSVQELLKPYVEAGTEATTAQQTLLGLGAPGEQQQMIEQIAGSPEMLALLAQGEEGILQNASATGGLRGGNVQSALAQFRPQLLSQLIQQRFQNLGTVAGRGQASAAGVGAAAQTTGANVADLLGQIGAARAGQSLAQGQAVSGIADAAGTVATLKALKAF